MSNIRSAKCLDKLRWKVIDEVHPRRPLVPHHWQIKQVKKNWRGEIKAGRPAFGSVPGWRPVSVADRHVTGSILVSVRRAMRAEATCCVRRRINEKKCLLASPFWARAPRPCPLLDDCPRLSLPFRWDPKLWGWVSLSGPLACLCEIRGDMGIGETTACCLSPN